MRLRADVRLRAELLLPSEVPPVRLAAPQVLPSLLQRLLRSKLRLRAELRLRTGLRLRAELWLRSGLLRPVLLPEALPPVWLAVPQASLRRLLQRLLRTQLWLRTRLRLRRLIAPRLSAT